MADDVSVGPSEKGVQRRGRKRVRVRVGPSRLHTVGKWWWRNSTNVLLWAAITAMVALLVFLVLNGNIRAPVPPVPE